MFASLLLCSAPAMIKCLHGAYLDDSGAQASSNSFLKKNFELGSDVLEQQAFDVRHRNLPLECMKALAASVRQQVSQRAGESRAWERRSWTWIPEVNS